MHGYPPTPIRLAQEVFPRHDDILEVHLAELGISGRLHERRGLNAVGLEIDDQEGDSAVPTFLWVGASKDSTPLSERAERGPHLVAVEDEVIPPVLGASPKRGEV